MSAPVENTCPDIDRAIEHLKAALSEIKDVIEDKQTFNSIEYEIDAAIDYFEDLRSSNDKLRSWGQDLEDELQSAGEEINSLEQKIETILKIST